MLVGLDAFEHGKACARGEMQERYSPWSIDEKGGMFLKTTGVSLAGSIFISRKCVHTMLRNTTIRACLVVATPGIDCLVRLSLSSSRLLVGTCPLAGGAYSKERFRLDCSAEYLLQVSLQALVSLFCTPNGTNLDNDSLLLLKCPAKALQLHR